MKLLSHRHARAAWLAFVCILAVLAGVAAVGAFHSWRAADDVASSRSVYVSVREGVAHETTTLQSAYAHRKSTRRWSAFFATTQRETALLTHVEGEAPAGQGPLVQQMQRAHANAVGTAARALSAHGTDAQLEHALRLLTQVRLAAATAQNDLSANLTSWPSTPLQRLELAALALIGLLGLLVLARHVSRLSGLSRTVVRTDSEIERLAQAAHSDSLTSLRNHRAFHDDLSEVIERRNTMGKPFSLLAFDLDGLKQMNDVNGHQAGDAYIRTVAGAIVEAVGAAGTVYRTGGDEFMAILPDARGWHALTLAHTIQRTTNQRTGRRALSVGITESTKTEGRRVLLHQADLALYEAKRARLLAVSYHPGLEPRNVDAGALGPTQHQKALAAALAQAVDAKDAGTRNHSETVAELSAALGARLGLSGERLERLRIAGLLHDVGKIGVSDAVLLKRGALGPDERTAVELHTTVGHSILTSAELHQEAVWVLHHHERVNGGGYPTGLAGQAIPLESRIIAVADAFEAMTGSRPYREASTPEQALAELSMNAGSQFDPDCVRALNELFGGGEIESPAVPAARPAIVAIA